LGFAKNNLIEINPQHDAAKSFPLIKQDLLGTSQIENAALADRSTLYGGNTDDEFKWKGKLENSKVSVAHRKVSPEYIATFGMQIIDGRDFSSDTAREKSNVIINESFAKIMGRESAVGKIIQSPQDNQEGVFTNMTVMGVMKDYVFGNIYDGSAAPAILFCRQGQFQRLIYARIKQRANVEEALAKIAGVMKKDDPSFPFQYRFVRSV
jgi:putative ABC transport system permease protein